MTHIIFIVGSQSYSALLLLLVRLPSLAQYPLLFLSVGYCALVLDIAFTVPVFKITIKSIAWRFYTVLEDRQLRKSVTKDNAFRNVWVTET